MNTLASLPPFLQRSVAMNGSTTQQDRASPQHILTNRLAERLGLQAGALDGAQSDFTPDKVADRILGFVGQRLRNEAANGADPEKLQGLLTQARQGVEKGFAEARKILDGMGLLKDQVASDIDTTYDKIQNGLQGLQSMYTAKTPGDSVTVAASSERFEGSAQTFDLQITTRDGDRLKISIANAAANWSKSSATVVGDGSSTLFEASRNGGSLQIGAWQVEVEGTLDDDERAALEKLFKQVQDISSDFYSGNLGGAFDRAMQLDIDGSQLAYMSLQLTQTSVREATDTYGSVAQQGGQVASAVNDNLMNYARSLLDALQDADKVAQDGKGTLAQLLDGAFRLDERFDEALLGKAGAFNNRLLDGLQGLH